MGAANFGISSTIMEVFGVATGAGAKIFQLIDNVPTINPLLNKGITPERVEGNIELKDVFFHYPSRPDVPVSILFNFQYYKKYIYNAKCFKKILLFFKFLYKKQGRGTLVVSAKNVESVLY